MTRRNSLLSIFLAIVFTVAPGLNSAGAAENRAGFQLSGVIIAIDHEARTITVSENVTNRKYTVRIPRNTRVQIQPIGSRGSSVEFEQLTVGFQFRGEVNAASVVDTAR